MVAWRLPEPKKRHKRKPGHSEGLNKGMDSVAEARRKRAGQVVIFGAMAGTIPFAGFLSAGAVGKIAYAISALSASGGASIAHKIFSKNVNGATLYVGKLLAQEVKGKNQKLTESLKQNLKEGKPYIYLDKHCNIAPARRKLPLRLGRLRLETKKILNGEYLNLEVPEWAHRRIE